MKIFKTFFYDPLVKALLFLYQNVPGGLGISVILLTLLVKLLLLPLSRKSLKSQKELRKIQPQLQKLQKKYKDDKETLARKTMEVYQEANINPFANIFVSLAQLPILFAIYRVFREVPAREGINPFFLGIDLSTPNTYLAIGAAILMFLQMKFAMPQPPKKSGDDFSSLLQKQMQYFLPVFIVIVLVRIPSAVALYIGVNGLLSVLEHRFLS